MRFTASHLRVRIRCCLAALSLMCAFTASASTQPRFGGTLRVELRTTNANLDPRTWKPGTREFAANEKLAELVFDRLLLLDSYGRFQPVLAVEWTHDANFRRWQFTIRSGVKFSDGSVLSAADVANSLQGLLPEGMQAQSSGNTVTFQSAVAVPDLLEQLASGRNFIFKSVEGQKLIGTSAFVLESVTQVASAIPARIDATTQRLVFRANTLCWAGRPFVDQIEVQLGVPALRSVMDLQLGKADVVEIAPDLVRRASQSNLRVWATSPVQLYGLRFESLSKTETPAVIREAVYSSLDRGTMAGVLLQKQAEPATALLPQWLSGYAFLFNVENDITRESKQTGINLPEPLKLRVEASEDLARLLAERVAINARQAGIGVQVVNRTAAQDVPAQLMLFSWRYTSLSPTEELRAMAVNLSLQTPSSSTNWTADPGRSYEIERSALGERRILPLVLLPEYFGVSASVRDWMPTAWGDLRLADVWLDRTDKSSITDSTQPAGQTGVRP